MVLVPGVRTVQRSSAAVGASLIRVGDERLAVSCQFLMVNRWQLPYQKVFGNDGFFLSSDPGLSLRMLQDDDGRALTQRVCTVCAWCTLSATKAHRLFGE